MIEKLAISFAIVDTIHRSRGCFNYKQLILVESDLWVLLNHEWTHLLSDTLYLTARMHLSLTRKKIQIINQK